VKLAEHCKVNGLHVVLAKITAQHTTKPAVLDAEYTLVQHRVDKGRDVRIDTPHGKLTAGPDAWSKDTLACAQELLTLMESDLISRHFDDGEGAEEHARNFIGGHEAPPQV
jgi:hypothetical protein